MTKIDKKNYQKPELIHIDDPAFDETGHGSWGFPGHGGGGVYSGGEGEGQSGNLHWRRP
jgi:hypothetical protein